MSKIFSITLLVLFLLTACAPASETVATPTPVGFIAPSIEVVDKFYKTIDDAQMKEDLLVSWNMLTFEFQCSPKIAPNCDTSKFQDKWWQVEVAYKLYDCGDNVVIAEETHSPRGDALPSTSATPKFTLFKVVSTEDGLLIDNISSVQALEDDCVLVSQN